VALACEDGAWVSQAVTPAGPAVVWVGKSESSDARILNGAIEFSARFAERLSRRPGSVGLPLRSLAPHDVQNAGLAGTAAFCMGAPLEAIEEAIRTFPGVPRRCELYELAGRRVLDDFGSNPAAARALFTLIRERGLDEKGVVVVASPRGGRGVTLNAETSRRMGALLRDVRLESLIVTASRDAVGPADRVETPEMRAYLGELARAGLEPTVTRTLRAAMRRAWAASRPGSLLVLQGAQGMDAGSAALREVAAGRSACWVRFRRLEPEPLLPRMRQAILA
jgi:UDP-N-acetylmuramoyl-L-alanyl-D-glutamate--2,6-diaminopimelate ligase